MAKLLQTLIPILFLLLAATANTARSQLQPGTISFSYDFSNNCPTPELLTFQGDAHIHQLTGGSFLRLTEAEQGAVGRVLHDYPLLFWNSGAQVGFQTTFSFTIRRNPVRSQADGIVFFIAPRGSTPPNGAADGNFGVFESSGNGPGVFAVEFDTFVNEWDPDYSHIGIDIGSRVSSNTTYVGGAIVGKQVNATINYFPDPPVISVAVSAGTETFEVSYECDLGGFLPQVVQVGLSASTGKQVAAHDIHWWSFSSIMIVPGPANKSRKQLIRQIV